MPQLLVSVSSTSALPRVKKAISTINGVEQVVTQREAKAKEPSPVAKRQLARLDELARLKENWDDEGALPIEPSILTFLRILIMADNNSILKDWTIFPATNGTVQLKAKKKRAVISVGNNDYSYFLHTGNGAEYANHEQLTVEALRQIVMHINE